MLLLLLIAIALLLALGGFFVWKKKSEGKVSAPSSSPSFTLPVPHISDEKMAKIFPLQIEPAIASPTDQDNIVSPPQRAPLQVPSNLWTLRAILSTKNRASEKYELDRWTLFYLRDYARPDGSLPEEFSSLVEEIAS
jgi:hypothetical protein